MSERTSWADIRAGLGEYRPKELVIRLADLFRGGVPARGRKREAAEARTRELVLDHAGAWYRSGPARLGDEVFGGYCFCCCFFPQAEEGPSVAKNVERIVAVVSTAHGWMRSLDGYFATLALPADTEERAGAIAAAVRHVIDLTVRATDCNEAWYPYAAEAISWLLQACGLAVTEGMQQLIARACAAFTSWTGPTDLQARAAADEVAFAAVREELRSRYGSG